MSPPRRARNVHAVSATFSSLVTRSAIPTPCARPSQQLCPNDCSGAGTCNFSNGTCSCLAHRVGDDCSSPYCSAMFDSRCVECTFDECTSCVSGFYVDDEGGSSECLSCTRHDPRCTRYPLKNEARSNPMYTMVESECVL